MAKSLLCYTIKGQLQRSSVLIHKDLNVNYCKDMNGKSRINFHRWLSRYHILKILCYLINIHEFSCDITDEKLI